VSTFKIISDDPMATSHQTWVKYTNTHNKAVFFFSPNELKFEQQVNFSERYDICYKMAELLKIETSSNGKNASELFDEFFHDIYYFDTEFQIFLFIAY